MRKGWISIVGWGLAASLTGVVMAANGLKPLSLTETSGDPGVSAFPDGDNIFSWIGTIKGSPGTVYQGLSYKLSLRFPTDYPFKPPLVKFETMCFHPNVDQYGNICLDILQDKWSSAYDVRTILLSIQSLLGEPNNDSPLNSYAAALWSNQEGMLLLHFSWVCELGVWISMSVYDLLDTEQCLQSCLLNSLPDPWVGSALYQAFMW